MLTTAWRASPWQALAFLGAFYGCLTAGNAALVLATGGLALGGPRAARALGVFSGLALLGFGLWQMGRAIGG